MKNKILGYIETNTNKKNLWVSVQKIYNDLSPENDNEFEKSILELINNNQIRLTTDSMGIILLSINSNVESVLQDLKSSAIQEMKEELEKCVQEENYEEASEWRDMINEAKNN